MSKLKHLLFDCDGVLVDTEYIAATKMTEALTELDVEITIDYYLRNFSGTTFSSIVKHYFEAKFSATDILSLVNKVEREVAAEVKAVDGVENMLSTNQIEKSVVSNSSVKTVEHALEVTDLAKYFSDKIFSSELVPYPKPSPEVYKLAVSSLNLDPKEILVIEDSESGVKAAITAGLNVIGFVGASHILPGHGEKLISLGVNGIASTMEELNSMITKFN